MSDPREQVEKAIESRKLIEQLEQQEARQRAQQAEASRIARRQRQTVTIAPNVETVTSITLDKSGQTTREQTRLRAPGTVNLSKVTPPKAIPPSKRDVKTFDTFIQEAYDKSNFPSIEEQKQVYLDAGPGGIDKVKFSGPKNLDEAINRLSYGFLEAIGGGVREGTFGLSGSLGIEKRPGGVIIQIAGAFATPTAADMAVNLVITKIAKSSIGQRIIQKMAKAIDKLGDSTPDPMWGSRFADVFETKQFEKIKGSEIGDISSSDVRAIKNSLKSLDTAEMLKQIQRNAGKLDDLTLEDFRILEKIKGGAELSTAELRKVKSAFKHLSKLVDETDELFLTAGEKKFFETEVGSLGQSTDDVRNALTREANLQKKLDLIVDFYKKNPTEARMVEVITDLTDFDDPYEVSDLINFVNQNTDLFSTGELLTAILPHLSKEDAKKLLEETTALSNDQIEKIRGSLTGKTKDKTIPDKEEPPITEPKPDDEKDEPTPVPPITIQEPGLDEPAPTEPKPPEPILDEPVPVEEEPVTETPPIRLTLKEKKKRKGLEKRIFMGPKQKWRVLFDGKLGWSGKARGVVDALDKAQKGRRVKKQPDIIIVELVKVK